MRSSVIERNEHGLLRQHQSGQKQAEDQPFSREVEAAEREGRHQGEQHRKRRACRRIEHAVRHQRAEAETVPDRTVWRSNVGEAGSENGPARKSWFDLIDVMAMRSMGPSQISGEDQRSGRCQDLRQHAAKMGGRPDV